MIWASVMMGMLMAVLSLFRHWHYLSRAFDLGFYVQDVWAIGQGIWRNTVGGFHVFDDHFSPVLILLAPLGRVPTAEALLILQAAAVASGLVPAYRLGLRYGGSAVGRLAVVWYGLSAAIWHAVAFDFHPVTLGVPLLMWLINSADEGRRRYLPVVLAVGLALMREDLAVLAGVVLVQTAALKGRWRETLWSIVPVSIGIGFIAWATFGSGMGGYHLWTRFSGSGAASIIDLVAGAGRNVVRPDPIISFASVLLPLLVVPALLGWKRSWPGLAMMLVNGVASYEAQASLYFQYFAPVVPFLLWGAIASWPSFRRGSARGPAMVASLGIFALLGPLFYIGFGAPDRFASTVALSGERREFSEVLTSIPDDVSVSATDFLVPHLSRREEVYPFPGPMVCPESLIFHVDRTSSPAYVAVEWEDAVPGMDWRAFLLDRGYEEIAISDQVSVWKLTGSARPSVTCSSMEDVRRRLGAAIVDRSGL
ncbi:MAG TPA: DUF2079 domain-containing protein [Acidimicrobiia bacterium]|nr:DUF2079 domain-containing protein [Acidimicrobiia bacterium]